MNLKELKVLLLDVDGVLTDGTKIYNRDGHIVGKNFNDKDFTAIKRFVEAGIHVEWISSDPFNLAIAKRRNIPFRLGSKNGVLSKAHLLPEICEDYNVDKSSIGYIGDDYFDIDILKEVGFPMCPKDAAYDARKYSKILIPCDGGRGVVANLYRTWSHQVGYESNLENVRAIDARERSL